MPEVERLRTLFRTESPTLGVFPATLPATVADDRITVSRVDEAAGVATCPARVTMFSPVFSARTSARPLTASARE